MSRKYNRHGFQNFGGRHTGVKESISPSNVDEIKWLQTAIKNAKSNKQELHTDVFDEVFKPIGAIIRYDLRKLGLIAEEAISGQDYKRIVLTAKAKGILASPVKPT